MKILRPFVFLAFLAGMSGMLRAESGSQRRNDVILGRNSVVIGGKQQDLYFYPAARSNSRSSSLLFVPGDGGWRGFAITVAQTAAAWGYDVYGLDTKHYLESLSGNIAQREAQVKSDFRQIGEWVRRGQDGRVMLVGWSEGAGLSVLEADDAANKGVFAGIVTMGLPEENILGWRWLDLTSYLTKRDPDEPKFKSEEFVSRVSPLPIWMIQASRDEYVPVDVGRKLFSIAREPKHYSVIQANNHRFEGGEPEFFRVLREGLSWIGQLSH